MCLKLPPHCNMHGGREGIVGGLPTVNVVVGMNGRLASTLATGQLYGAVRDHLVDIHIGLRARARLKYDQGELVIQLPLDYLIRSTYDEFRYVCGKLPQFPI